MTDSKKWKRITHPVWYDTSFLPDMPGSYELALGRSRDSIHTVYVGYTAGKSMGLRKRVKDHARIVAGDKFWRKIKASENSGFYLWVAWKTAKTSSAARKEEERKLKTWWKYPWNTQGMPWSGEGRIRD